MAVPTINTYSVNEENIQLYWKASPKSEVKKWNVYGSTGVTIDFIPPEKGVVLNGGMFPENAFNLIREGIPNRDTELTPGSVYTLFTKEELGISEHAPYYFYIMPVGADGNEIGVPDPGNVQAVPFRDSHFVDNAGEPVNVVYKSFEVDLWPLIGWDENRYINVNSLLGRPANMIQMDAIGENCWVRFNSINNDPISVRENSPYKFDLNRGGLKIEKIYVHNPTTGDVTLRIWVAG